MLNENQARLADIIEAAALRDFYAAAPVSLAWSLGLSVQQVGGATLLVASGVPRAMFNRAIGLGMRRPATEADLDAVISTYREAGCPSYWIHLMPIAAPGGLPVWLESRGMAPPAHRAWAKMLRGAAAPPPAESSLDVRPLQLGEEAAVAEAVCTAFDLSPPFVPWIAALARRRAWRAFGAFHNGRAVGGGYLYVTGSSAWLGLCGVRAEYRGRGAQRALLAMRLQEAIAAGCAQLVTETGETAQGEPNPALWNMQRCGFTRVCSRVNYAQTHR